MSVGKFAIAEKCSRKEDWIYAQLDDDVGAISTVIIVSDWRNSLGNLDTTGQPRASLSVGFAEYDPGNYLASTPQARWKNLGTDYHS